MEFSLTRLPDMASMSASQVPLSDASLQETGTFSTFSREPVEECLRARHFMSEISNIGCLGTIDDRKTWHPRLTHGRGTTTQTMNPSGIDFRVLPVNANNNH
ncbi:hypothetical protein [Nesterenkonia sp. CF4.4]|uniref:hypothetical protein n=1 Tax=Nesterenkonia sp. CF4.4 TaxID=3373079 RepID=UPI003EE7A336